MFEVAIVTVAASAKLQEVTASTVIASAFAVLLVESALPLLFWIVFPAMPMLAIVDTKATQGHLWVELHVVKLTIITVAAIAKLKEVATSTTNGNGIDRFVVAAIVVPSGDRPLFAIPSLLGCVLSLAMHMLAILAVAAHGRGWICSRVHKLAICAIAAFSELQILATDNTLVGWVGT